jgi:dTDP-4-amino-4,6-dideoxygalactose transaminase
MLRNHGMTRDNFMNSSDGQWYYEMQALGYNYRLTDIQSALGVSQLKKLNNFIKRRRQIVAIYNKAFLKNPYFYTPVEHDYAYSSYHLYPIRLKNQYVSKRSEIFSALRKNGIGVQVHYIPVYRQPFYKKLGFKVDRYPVAEDFYSREISLPIYPDLKNSDIKTVIQRVLNVFRESQETL